MPTWKLRFHPPFAEPPEPAPAARPRTARAGTMPNPVDEPIQPLTEAERQQRLDRLRRRRASFDYDLSQSELARQPNNPWRDRMKLIDEAIATVVADDQRIQQAPPAPNFPLPATPITDIRATTGEPAEVGFRIGPEQFLFEEEVDWDDRGYAIQKGVLRLQHGDVTKLFPANLPADLRGPLQAHLNASIALLANDLRDRALGDEPMPTGATLADLATPCPDVGGWRDWLGRCTVAQERLYQRQQLEFQRRRLLDQQADAMHDLAVRAEQLPVIYRRLAEIDREIAALGG